MASAIMRAHGLEPDFAGLDRELGSFGSAHGAVGQLVADCDGRVAGSLALSWTLPGRLKLSGLYVDAALRGQGAGRLLLEQAIGRARDCGAQQIYLETVSSMAAACHLYTALGWRRHQRLAPDSGAEWSYLLMLPTP